MSRKSCGVTLSLSCSIFTKNFNCTHRRLRKHMHLMSKRSNEKLLKTKTDISIFLVCFVLIVTYSQQLVLFGIKLTGHLFETLTYRIPLKY